VAAIEVEGLRVRRGASLVLPGIDLTVDAGRLSGLLGPSGSGKTTLMRAIAGVQIVEAGSVRVLGQPAGAPELRHRVGYVTQAPSVYADLTVRENLAYFAGVLGVERSAVDDAIRTVDLGAHAEQVVRTLSGGRACSSWTSRRSGSIPCCVATSGRRSGGSRATARRCSCRAT
jgi:ABC-2 type transport system ATP-binding protein